MLPVLGLVNLLHILIPGTNTRAWQFRSCIRTGWHCHPENEAVIRDVELHWLSKVTKGPWNCEWTWSLPEGQVAVQWEDELQCCGSQLHEYPRAAAVRALSAVLKRWEFIPHIKRHYMLNGCQVEQGMNELLSLLSREPHPHVTHTVHTLFFLWWC